MDLYSPPGDLGIRLAHDPKTVAKFMSHRFCDGGNNAHFLM